MELVEPEANCQLQKMQICKKKLQRHLAVFGKTTYTLHVYKNIELAEPEACQLQKMQIYKKNYRDIWRW
jgi:hypothetical protein